MLDGDPTTDTAVGWIECSSPGISRQSSDRGQCHAATRADRMQGAIRIDVSAAASDDQLAAMILAGSEPVYRHPALVNVHAPSKLVLFSGVGRGVSSGGCVTSS